jgi:hypothetical protein
MKEVIKNEKGVGPMEYYYGKVIALFGSSDGRSYAAFDDGKPWKRLQSVCVPLAAAAKSDNSFVSIYYQSSGSFYPDVVYMYVY